MQELFRNQTISTPHIFIFVSLVSIFPVLSGYCFVMVMPHLIHWANRCTYRTTFSSKFHYPLSFPSAHVPTVDTRNPQATRKVIASVLGPGSFYRTPRPGEATRSPESHRNRCTGSIVPIPLVRILIRRAGEDANFAGLNCAFAQI